MARPPSKPAAKKVVKAAAKKPAPPAPAKKKAAPPPAKKQAAPPPAKKPAPPPAKKQAAPAPAKKQAAPPPAKKQAAPPPAKKQAAPPPAKKAAAPAAPAKKPAAAPVASKPAALAPADPNGPRFGFLAVPVVRDPAGLTQLLRRQLVVDSLLSVGRVTTPDRIPAAYFSVGIHRWRITERGKPLFDVVQNTAFFADSDEPVGLERIGGSWAATGRETQRGLALDLPHLAWELNRDWPGRRLPLGAEPKLDQTVEVVEGVRDQPWPADATFV